MAERYNYYENVKDDIRNELGYYDIEVDEDNIDEVYEEMYDNLWTSDSVTGNGSGSYTFNTWQAEEKHCSQSRLIARSSRGVRWRLRPKKRCRILRCYYSLLLTRTSTSRSSRRNDRIKRKSSISGTLKDLKQFTIHLQ